MAGHESAKEDFCKTVDMECDPLGMSIMFQAHGTCLDKCPRQIGREFRCLMSLSDECSELQGQGSCHFDE